MKLLLAGGRQGREASVADRDHRPLYDLAVLAELDPSTLALTRLHTDPGRRFGAPSVDGDAVVVCTEREVLRVRGDHVDRWSHPLLDDLHHAAVVGGRLVAVSTGIDALVTHDGALLPVHPRAGHRDRVHANYVFEQGGTWVTRGTAGDVYRIEDGRTVPLADTVVHDGIPDRSTAWFTAVDGRLIQADLEAGRIVRTLRLDPGRDEPLGWCRGLAILDGVAWVGFTRLRTTRLRRHLAWARGRLRGRRVATRRPTRVVAIDLATGRALANVDLAPVGIDALFGLALR